MSTEDGGKYVLGDEALAVLKDLRRWLKLYDEKLNRYDVRFMSPSSALGTNSTSRSRDV